MSTSLDTALAAQNYLCTICRDTGQIDQRNTWVHGGLGNKHPFHKECIITWIKNNPHCPVCRADIDRISLLSWKDKAVVWIRNSAAAENIGYLVRNYRATVENIEHMLHNYSYFFAIPSALIGTFNTAFLHNNSKVLIVAAVTGIIVGGKAIRLAPRTKGVAGHLFSLLGSCSVNFAYSYLVNESMMYS